MYLEVKDNKLILPKCEIEFEHLIYDYIVVPDCIILLIDSPADTDEVDNIQAVSFDGKKLWTVQSVTEILPDVTKPSAYVGMKLMENGNISATNWVGMTYEISIKDGKILSSHFTK